MPDLNSPPTRRWTGDQNQRCSTGRKWRGSGGRRRTTRRPGSETVVTELFAGTDREIKRRGASARPVNWSPSAPKPCTGWVRMPTTPSRRRDFRRQGAAPFQPLDLPLSQRRGGVRRRRRNAAARKFGGSILAGPVHPGAAAPGDLPSGAAGRGGVGDAGGAGAGAQTGWELLARSAGRWRPPRRTAPARSAPPQPRMCWPGLDGRIAAVIDSGPCQVGVESTVLDLSGAAAATAPPGRGGGGGAGGGDRARAARRGADRAGRRGAPVTLTGPAGFTLCAKAAAAAAGGRGGEGMRHCWRSGRLCRAPGLMFQLSESGKNPAEAAARLFGGLHWLDAQGARSGLRRDRRHGGAGNRTRARYQ